jgi:hypothetical protein
MKNLGREFATMSEDERRRFAMQNEGGTDAGPEELDLEPPRTDEESGDQSDVTERAAGRRRDKRK